MDSIERIIGEDRALELNFDSVHGQICAECWSAALRLIEFDDNGDLIENSTLLASARLVRVNLIDDEWLDSLDAESGDLQAVGAALVDRDRIVDVDEDSLFADSLVVIDFVHVIEEHRGSRLSEALVRGIGHIFRSDIVALMPASLSSTDSGELFLDEPKKRGLRRHWERSGFVQIPETEVMLLPFGTR